MHDALALGIAADPSLITSGPVTRVDVELNGEHTRGMTVGDLRAVRPDDRDNALVVMKADGTRFVRRWFEVLSNLD